jgi:hypothetical protein
MLVLERTSAEVDSIPPNQTRDVVRKLLPVIVTTVPPVEGAETGRTFVTVTGGPIKAIP